MYADPIQGVDVSMHQPNISWDAILGAGCLFAWAKTSEGIGYTDPSWRRHQAEARKRPIKFGGYHYATAAGPDYVGDARAEAEWFVSQGGCEDSMPGALDMEHTSLSRNLTIEWARIWCERVHELTGWPQLPVYWNPNFATDGGNACPNDPRLQPCFWWMPAYGSNPPTPIHPPPTWTPDTNGPRQPEAWQYTSNGQIPGYAGALDLNLASAAEIAQLTGTAPPQEVPMHRPVFCPEWGTDTAWEVVWVDGARHRRGIASQVELHALVAIGELDSAEYVNLTGDQAWWFMSLPQWAPPSTNPQLITCAADTAWAREVAKLGPGEVGRFYLVPNRYMVRIHDDNQWNSDAYVGVKLGGEFAEPFLWNQRLVDWGPTVAADVDAEELAAALMDQGLTATTDNEAIAVAVADEQHRRLAE